jgi:hypothetical protein
LHQSLAFAMPMRIAVFFDVVWKNRVQVSNHSGYL